MNTLKCRLLSLMCYKSSEEDGDEAYLKLNSAKLWPQQSKWHKMTSNSEVKLNIVLTDTNKVGQLKLSLYDKDTFFDDRLGSFVLNMDSPGGPFRTDLGSPTNGARYCLTWEVYN